MKIDKFLRGWGLMSEKKREEVTASTTTATLTDPGRNAAGAGAASSSSSSAGSGEQEVEDDGRNWFARALSGHGSSLALAFVANKALFPVRAPITLGLTPAVARALRVNAARSAAAASANGKRNSGGGGV